jgi:FixJ family two-component response regulator
MNEKNKTFREPLVSIVDDDDSIRRSAQRLLRCCGLRAETFSSAEDFLSSSLVAETSCLLLDVCMPGMDGLELQGRLAETAPVIPIIFLSAQASEAAERQALKAGAAKFLRKPVSKEGVLQAIRSVLEKPLNHQCKD